MNIIKKIINFFASDECYKQSIGYTCHHRDYGDGTKECGEFPPENDNE